MIVTKDPYTYVTSQPVITREPGSLGFITREPGSLGFPSYIVPFPALVTNLPLDSLIFCYMASAKLIESFSIDVSEGGNTINPQNPTAGTEFGIQSRSESGSGVKVSAVTLLCQLFHRCQLSQFCVNCHTFASPDTSLCWTLHHCGTFSVGASTRVYEAKPKPPASGKMRNFASSECGAKVISSSKEAQHTQSVLNENRDEYMILPCSAK